MKSLKSSIIESQQEQINEYHYIPWGDPVIDGIALSLNIGALLWFFNSFVGFGASASDGPLGALAVISDAFKRIKNDIKFKKTVERLLKDKEIIDFLNLPDKKRTGAKWQELLQSKLTEEELESTNAITSRVASKGGFDNKIKHTFYK